MKLRPWRVVLFGWLLARVLVTAHASGLPEKDTRASVVRDYNTPREFPAIQTRAEWVERAREVREQVLVSCGLWPMPEKTPLKAHLSGLVKHEDYSVEKVYFQTSPGVYLAGNLYRPVGQGAGPFPAVLNPHGHWQEGRLSDDETGSVPARCITMARHGIIAFSYDMVGYNDTFFPEQSDRMRFVTNYAKIHRSFATNDINLLWNISLMGVQTWNSIRALDFLVSLSDVDKLHLGCTGASGGGTQTFMLGAIDDRLTMQAPIVMVSHVMQGGCLCENAPGLRVKYSNMEIAAAPAPRLQILVAATGDWTKTTMTMEGPALNSVYHLFDAESNLRYSIFNYKHNYNRTTRSAVYDALGDWLLPPGSAPVMESPYKKEPDARLLVFPNAKLPADALTETDLIEHLIVTHKYQWKKLKPSNPAGLAKYREVIEPLWRHSLQLDKLTPGDVWFAMGEPVVHQGYISTPLTFGRPGAGDRLPAVLYKLKEPGNDSVTVIVNSEGKAPYVGANLQASGMAYELLKQGESVLVMDTFLTGENADPAAAGRRHVFTNYFTTYNKTDLQERVQDIATATAMARHFASHVALCGVGSAGAWALLASPVADATAVDLNGVDPSSDEVLMQPAMFVPGIRCFGTFEGAAGLAAPNPLLIHHTGQTFSSRWLSDVYGKVKQAGAFRASLPLVEDAAVANWIGSLNRKDK